MSFIFIYAIKAYQLTLGRALPRVCRFEPSCSAYAVEAIREHGLRRGLTMGIWRILRCNPFFAGGWDPVPRRGDENE